MNFHFQELIRGWGPGPPPNRVISTVLDFFTLAHTKCSHPRSVSIPDFKSGICSPLQVLVYRQCITVHTNCDVQILT